jgi:single-strand DNA-binding protein
MNTVALSGRLVREPEMRSTSQGTSVTSFSIAVDRPGVKDKADFIDCVAWRNTAEFISKWFHKGDPIEVTGIITSRSWEDKQGNKRKSVEVVCDRAFFQKSKKNDITAPESQQEYDNGFKELNEDDGDLPF